MFPLPPRPLPLPLIAGVPVSHEGHTLAEAQQLFLLLLRQAGNGLAQSIQDLLPLLRHSFHLTFVCDYGTSIRRKVTFVNP